MRNFKGVIRQKNGLRCEIDIKARDASHAIMSVNELKPVDSTLVCISEQGDW